MQKNIFMLFMLLILFYGCTPEQKIVLVNQQSAQAGINFFTLSVEEGISGIYIDNNASVYFQAIRGPERNPWQEYLLAGAPPYPIDVRYVSEECGDAFIVGVGGSESFSPDWIPTNFSIDCEGEKRKEEFRTAWKIANELERLNLPFELQWEKEALIMEARSIQEADLTYHSTNQNI